jgi:replicative DNA helicase
MTAEPTHAQHATVLPMRDRAADDIARIPPNDIDAEQAVVGSLMLAPAVIAEVSAVMDPADHYRPTHETIHRTILDLHAQGMPADPITLGHRLERLGELNRVGGKAYLHTLVQAVPTTANAAYYAEIVHDLARRRHSIEAGTRIVQAGMAPDATEEDLRELLALGAETLPGLWADPIPLNHQPKLPTFPTHVLPTWLREFADAIAEETQTPTWPEPWPWPCSPPPPADGSSSSSGAAGESPPTFSWSSPCPRATASPRSSRP